MNIWNLGCTLTEATKTKTKGLKRGSLLLGVVLIPVMFVSPVMALAAIKYAPGAYEIDAAHTRASFTVPHFVISRVEGRSNDVKGSFRLGEPFSASTASITVQIKSIDTGAKQRDDDLRSKNYFEVSKYPTMTFVVKSLRGTPESCRVIGALTIKDVTKEGTLDGKYTGVVTDPLGNQRAAIRLTGAIEKT